MKIIFVSLYNCEAIGTRQLYSLFNDSKLVFLKLNMSPQYETRQRNSFKNTHNEITEKELDLFVDFITNENPDLISISLVSIHFHILKRLYPRIKNFKIVLGGWHPTLDPESCLPYCDFLCRGEGGEALWELANCLNAKKSPENIKNIWSKDFRNPVRPLTDNIDSFVKFDDICYIEDNALVKKDPYSINNRYGIMASVGCPYRCSYCSNSYMGNIYPNWHKTRFRSVENVIGELHKVKASFPNILRINFYDEIFCLNKKWGREFFDRYDKEIKLSFVCEIFPGLCDEELINIIKKHLSGVWMGVQSGSERVKRDVFKRFYTNDVVLKQAGLFNKYGINIRYDFIFDNPFETFDESLESIGLILKLEEPFTLNLFSLKYFPNTEITKMAIERGIINKNDTDDNINEFRCDCQIKERNDCSKSNFINYLATYISFLAGRGEVGKNKNRIREIIKKYKSDNRMDDVKGLVDSVLGVKQKEEV